MLGFKLLMHFFCVCLASIHEMIFLQSLWETPSLDFFRLNIKTSFSRTIDLPCFLLWPCCFPIVSPCTVSVYARLVHCLCCTCACSPCVCMHECGLRSVLLNQIWGIVDTVIVIVSLQARHKIRGIVDTVIVIVSLQAHHKIWGIVDSFIIVVLL